MKDGVSMTLRWSSSGGVAMPCSTMKERARSMEARYSSRASANVDA
jgi:hypothetical protein